MKEYVYQKLEARMLSYSDYADIPVIPINDPMVPIIGSLGLTASKIRADAMPATGQKTYVRQGVYDRLQVASELLRIKKPFLQLDVGYGYRSLDVQRTRYEEVLISLVDMHPADVIPGIAHRFVAVPEVAGHPAGAAVDVQLCKNGVPLHFGTNMWDFEKKSYTYSPDVNREERVNRWLLHDTMVEAGFAPFLGEWWHFSYGDKEWAKTYDQPAALYDQIEFRADEVTDV